jgi:hypothetical protein
MSDKPVVSVESITEDAVNDLDTLSTFLAGMMQEYFFGLEDTPPENVITDWKIIKTHLCILNTNLTNIVDRLTTLYGIATDYYSGTLETLYRYMQAEGKRPV